MCLILNIIFMVSGCATATLFFEKNIVAAVYIDIINQNSSLIFRHLCLTTFSNQPAFGSTFVPLRVHRPLAKAQGLFLRLGGFVKRILQRILAHCWFDSGLVNLTHFNLNHRIISG